MRCLDPFMRLCYLLLTVACWLAAQGLTPRFSFGVTGGVPLGRISSDSNSFSSEESRRYTIGPAVDLSLTSKLSVSANLLYKRTGSSTGNLFYNRFFDSGPDSAFQYGVSSAARFRAHSLELPVIGRYHFGREGSRWRPFLGTGFAFQTAWQQTNSRFLVRNKETTALTFSDIRSNRRTPTDTGVVANMGLTFKKGPLVFVPEIRYTRWGSASPARDRHQADALLTLRFGR